MKWRTFLILAAMLVVLVGGLYAIADTASARQAFDRYQAANRLGDYEAAAALIGSSVLDFDARTRSLALEATESELLALPTLETIAALGVREAVLAGRIGVGELQEPIATVAERRALHALLRRAIIAKPLADVALLAILQTGPRTATAWIGPRAYAGDLQTLLISVLVGMRIGLVDEGEGWRIDYLPAMQASADGNDAIGATLPVGSPGDHRKLAFNILLAHGDVPKQTALWTAVERTGGR